MPRCAPRCCSRQGQGVDDDEDEKTPLKREDSNTPSNSSGSPLSGQINKIRASLKGRSVSFQENAEFKVGGRYKVGPSKLNLWGDPECRLCGDIKLRPSSEILILTMRVADLVPVAFVVCADAEQQGTQRGFAAGWVRLDAEEPGGQKPVICNALDGSWEMDARYTVRHPAVLRKSAQLTSDVVGEVPAGDEVLVLELGLDQGAADGKPRLRCLVKTDAELIGWMSPETSSGDRLLDPVNLLGAGIVRLHKSSLRSSRGSNNRPKSSIRSSGFLTTGEGDAPWKAGGRYRVLECLVLRETAGLSSRALGKLPPGTIVDVTAVRSSPCTKLGMCPVASVTVADEGKAAGKTGWIRCAAKDGHDYVDTRDQLEAERLRQKIKEMRKAAEAQTPRSQSKVEGGGSDENEAPSIGGRYMVATKTDLWSGPDLNGHRISELMPCDEVLLLALREVVRHEDEGNPGNSEVPSPPTTITALVAPRTQGAQSGWVPMQGPARPSSTEGVFHPGAPTLKCRKLAGSWEMKARYAVASACTLRQSENMTSPAVGEVDVGDEVLVLDLRLSHMDFENMDEPPRLRALVQTDSGLIGWLSPEAKSGLCLLSPVNLLGPEVVEVHKKSISTGDAAGPTVRKSCSAWSTTALADTDLSPWKSGGMYRALEDLVLRERPDVTSAELCPIQAGTVLEVHEVKTCECESVGICPYLLVTAEGKTQKGWVRSSAEEDGHDVVDIRDQLEFDKVRERLRTSEIAVSKPVEESEMAASSSGDGEEDSAESEEAAGGSPRSVKEGVEQVNDSSKPPQAARQPPLAAVLAWCGSEGGCAAVRRKLAAGDGTEEEDIRRSRPLLCFVARCVGKQPEELVSILGSSRGSPCGFFKLEDIRSGGGQAA